MLRRPVQFHPKALAEAEAAKQWYRERSPEAAAAFLVEVNRAVRQISEAPARWPPYLSGTRRVVLRRFPFLVVYRELPKVLQVIAVAHPHRLPGYWRSR